MYLISVYFDDRSNKAIQKYINQVAKKTSNDFMISHKVPPHLTISSIEAKNPEILIPAFERIKDNLKSDSIYIPTTGQIFPYVFCINPVLNEYLQKISETVFKEISQVPDTNISKYYKPWSWFPHITIGKTLDREQMSLAFDVMQDRFAPINATVKEIGLAKVNPHEDIMRYTLK